MRSWTPTGEWPQLGTQATKPAAEQSPRGLQDTLEAAMESILTIRGGPTNQPPNGPVVPAAEPAEESVSQVEDIFSLVPAAEKLMTKHKRGEQEDKEDLDKLRRGAAGTHRFTLVDKDPAQIFGGKKASSCRYSLSL